MKKTWIIIGIIAVVIIVSLFGYYNKFITANEQIDGQWAQVEAQYQRRFDLIPNLVESVKGIMAQEKDVFGLIADARTKYAGATTVNEKAEAATEVESALSRLLVVMENYPELKSAENVNTLMAQLEGTENRISVERGRFNNTVRDYNVMVKRFPGNMMAGMFGFDERSYFEAAAGSEQAPEVKF
ncbi:LemA family protein [Candidatus Falkowbacteria bacterium CG10_big_fil_rev_8_21_14_0_10_43_11]|uniref:LemA family protein n=1 Tax=Candidatus Falkowbacteria bacterium CG10_big_fil_rev_8_21_14_0_10_43_11 TaxID=1974568 RepID=A0A2M6WLV2_9BACT|nr:MAG: LemA family protein [Candidatus Falkowbacteria bacterium CG10_big_fil_rev_8_21_14_0_10_43_11]